MKKILLLSLLSGSIMAQNSPFTFVQNEQCRIGLQDEKKQEVLPKKYTDIRAETVGNDYLLTASNKFDRTYFLYHKGKTIPLQYANVKKLNDQLLVIENDDKNGLIDTKGKGIALMQYDRIQRLGSTLALTTKNDKKGVLDEKGKSILANEFDEIKDWERGHALIARKGKTWYQYSPKGKLQMTYTYSNVVLDNEQSVLLAVQQGEKWGLIDAKNKVVIPLTYAGAKVLDNDWIMLAQQPDLWQLVNSEMQPVNPQLYQNGWFCRAGSYAIMTQQNKMGILDATGKELVPNKYTAYWRLNNDKLIALQQEDETIVFYDIANQKWLSGEATDVFHSSAVGTNFWSKSQEGWQLLGADLKPIRKEYYKKADATNEPKYMVVTDKENKVGLLNQDTGEQILPMEYTAIHPKGLFFRVKKTGTDWYHVNIKNKKMDCVD